MKKFLISLMAVLGGATALICIAAARYESKILPNTFVGTVDVGGLDPADAAKKLRVWWESEKRVPLDLVSNKLKRPLPPMTASQLGVALDDNASVAELPVQDFVGAAGAAVGQSDSGVRRFEPKFKSNGVEPVELEKLVEEAAGKPQPARAIFAEGEIVRTPEAVSLQLEKSGLESAVVDALKGDLKVKLPIEEAPKHVPDEQLATITDVIDAFTTHFPTRMVSRNTNIRLASGKLNGVILMPGEQISFNKTVGRRTIEAGFKEAGVFKNGKHDHGVGGGICQVSSTLYNAALYSDLMILKRHNHSMPVAYLPPGRDATVDYGSLDLAFENTYKTPIAITSDYENGSLTFRILGKKDPGMKVKIVTEGHKTWSRGIKVVQDRTLKPGTHKVTDKGSLGHSIFAYRLVYENGVLVKKESLGRSFYPGAPKLIASNGPYDPGAAKTKTLASKSLSPIR